METRTINDLIYIIKSKGKGNAGEVFKARLKKERDYASKGSIVAIKIYNDWVLKEPDQASRIDSELQTSIKINSENVVKSYELIEFKNKIFLIMEYLSGKTLSEWLDDKDELSFNEIIQISRQILDFLNYLATFFA